MEPTLLFKFILIGDVSVGKSSLLKQFVEAQFIQNFNITIGVEFSTKIITIDETCIKLQIWDTSGQESFQSVTRLYYRAAAGAIMVYDITDRASFENIKNWQLQAQENGNPKMQFLLIGNKIDLPNRQVEYWEAQQFANENGCLFAETSAKQGDNVEYAFLELANAIYQLIIQEPEFTKKNHGIKVLKGGNLSKSTQGDISLDTSQQMPKNIQLNEFREYHGDKTQKNASCNVCCADF